MQNLTDVAHRVRPGAMIIAEDTSGNEYITKQQHDGGCGFDAQWEVSFPHAVRQMLGLQVEFPANLITLIGAIITATRSSEWSLVIVSHGSKLINSYHRSGHTQQPGEPVDDANGC